MFQEIKDAVSTREAASFYGLKIGRGGMACCPFHNDKHPSMKVDARFHCFGCGADGDVINYVQRLFSLRARDAAFKLVEDFHLNIDFKNDPHGKPKLSKSERNTVIRNARRNEYEDKVRTAYAEEIKKFRMQLAGISRTFHEWEVSFFPEREDWDNDRIDKRYVTAIHVRDRLESTLDILDNGTDADIYEEFKHRKETIEYYERKIAELNR